jgi:hypothetical protein
MQRISGEMHPDTIWAMHNLASTLEYQGKLDEAAAMKREMHSHTISAMGSLTRTYTRLWPELFGELQTHDVTRIWLHFVWKLGRMIEDGR